MTIDMYNEKLNDPKWIYKSINLWDDWYIFIKDISEFMVFNKALNPNKNKIQIGMDNLLIIQVNS